MEADFARIAPEARNLPDDVSGTALRLATLADFRIGETPMR